MKTQPLILLSFDVEEFDMPLEYDQVIPMEEQMEVGYSGLLETMKIIDSTKATSTFFTTANFAQQYPATIQSISDNHEIASHTFYHTTFEPVDLLSSKQKLEEITGKTVHGLRMPRMRHVEMQDVINAGYTYDSSVNPTWIPGRYNNLSKPRTAYKQEQMLRVPASVSPMRLPLFWLAFKNYPYPLFRHLVLHTMKKDGYVCLYFHPWEFVDLSKYNMPGYTKRLAGKPLQDRLYRLIGDLSKEGTFTTMQDCIVRKQLHNIA
ncbi:MAG: DUF3473 domain-containing protein [Filimonas sp.]|nr:DUF3473 domain-containing protein [Filimonas sp.]